MIPFSVAVVWLAMVGGQRADFVPNGAYPYTPTCPSGYVMDGNFDSELPCAKPAEHVIEIRTKRTLNGWTRVCSLISTGYGRNCEEIKTPTYCPQMSQCQDLTDVTKTLYIDGERVGVIRETEEK